MRHAIKGLKPGQHIHVAGRIVQLHPVDGGFEWTDKQREELEDAGHKLIPVSDVAPETEAELSDEEADAEAAARDRRAQIRAAARAAQADAEKVPSKGSSK